MASIEKRSGNSYRITVSCGYDQQGKKLFKKKTFTIEPTLTDRQREKKLNEIAVLFEKEVRTDKLLSDTEKCFRQFLQLSGYDAVLLDIERLQALMADARKFIVSEIYGGEGGYMASVEYKGNGSVLISVSSGYDSSGKQIRHRMIIPASELVELTEKQRQKEIEKRKVLFEEKVKNGEYLDGDKITFEEFINKWLRDYAELQLAPKTIHEHKSKLTHRIIPALGHIKLSKLQPHHLIEFYKNLSENGMRLDSKYTLVPQYVKTLRDIRKNINVVSDWTIKNLLKGNATTYDMADKISKYVNVPLSSMFVRVESDKKLSKTTINDYHRLISIILATAVHWQHIQTNPCERVKPLKIDRKGARHYDDNVVGIMFELLEAAPLKYQAAVYIAIFGGLRLGEVAALEWTDIDFKKNLININKAAQYISGVGSFDKKPKTDNGCREIALPALAMEKINRHRLDQIEYRLKMGGLWEHHNKVFTQENGKPIFHDTLSKWFNKWLKANNLPKIKFHELRHTNASLLIAQGVDIATVSKRLGHANVAITARIYTHPIKKMDNEAAEKLGNLFTSSKQTLSQI